MGFWAYHTKGDLKCEACAEPPSTCPNCENGLVHTQFKSDLEEVQDKCDSCATAITFAAYHDELS